MLEYADPSHLPLTNVRVLREAVCFGDQTNCASVSEGNPVRQVLLLSVSDALPV